MLGFSKSVLLLIKRLSEHKARYYANTLLSLEELEEWELVFAQKKAKKSSANNTMSKQPSVKTEEDLITDETKGTLDERLALSKQLVGQSTSVSPCFDFLKAPCLQLASGERTRSW